ncbi:MAG: hypothetical protein M0Z25_04005 [Nitrospiraceae bacterium]|nr:hypothetical protein [Nitrospiraceae bacterium]
MRKTLLHSLLFGSLCLFLAACSTATPYNGAFRDMNGSSGNGKLVAFPEGEAYNAAKEALVSHGFLIDAGQSNLDNGLILANRKMQDSSDPEVSYEITATVNLLPKDTNSTFVALSANEKKIRYQKERIWWHLLWIIPLFPIGTEYHTVERPENTVTDQSFYNDFFTSLDQTLRAISHPVKKAAAGAIR